MALTTQQKEIQITSLSSSSSKISTSIFGIPKEVIIQNILVLIEPKVLGRLRCVSTWWNKLISSPTFCLFYYRFRSLHRLHHQINWSTNQIGPDIYEFFFSTTDSAHLSDHYRWTLNLHKISSVSESSCFGMICLYSAKNACIYNPTTRSVVVNLPPFNNNFNWSPKFYLGFVPSTNRIKVLCFSTRPSNNRTYPGFTSCDVLTLPEDLSNGWRKVGSPPLSKFNGPIVADAEGAVYLLSHCCTRLYRFDLEREMWSKIKLPALTLPLAVEFMGYLCLRSRTVESSYEIWILKNDNVWVKEWVLNNYPRDPEELLIPLHYDEKLERILMKNFYGYLSWYWIKTGIYEELGYLHEVPRKNIYNIKYVETLVSLQTIRDIANVRYQT